jgi:hypothetical protein
MGEVQKHNPQYLTKAESLLSYQQPTTNLSLRSTECEAGLSFYFYSVSLCETRPRHNYFNCGGL